MELAIDTSSNMVGVALSHEGEVLASLNWRTVQNHTVELLPNIVGLLQRAQVELNSLEAVIVAKGPGSFNGLRVGISTAEGLAFALGVPLLGVSTLEAEAYRFAFTGLPLRSIHRAGRQEIATALYRQKGSEWRCLEAENLSTVEAVCRRTRQRTLFCGEIPANVADELQQSLGKRALICPSAAVCRAASLAMLGWRKLRSGEHDASGVVQPLYLRPPHITKPREKIPFFRTSRRAMETEKWKSPD